MARLIQLELLTDFFNKIGPIGDIADCGWRYVIEASQSGER